MVVWCFQRYKYPHLKFISLIISSKPSDCLALPARSAPRIVCSLRRPWSTRTSWASASASRSTPALATSTGMPPKCNGCSGRRHWPKIASRSSMGGQRVRPNRTSFVYLHFEIAIIHAGEAVLFIVFNFHCDFRSFSLEICPVFSRLLTRGISHGAGQMINSRHFHYSLYYLL